MEEPNLLKEEAEDLQRGKQALKLIHHNLKQREIGQTHTPLGMDQAGSQQVTIPDLNEEFQEEIQFTQNAPPM
jgi:hypothetical protein